MAYNYGFPATYQPMYQPQQYQTPVMQMTQQAQQAGNGSIIWVQGEQAAKSYLVAPNSSVVLFDSEDKIIYLKSADASGMPSMKILDYTIRGDTNTQAVPAADYATKADLKALEDKIRDLEKRHANRLMKEENDE